MKPRRLLIFAIFTFTLVSGLAKADICHVGDQSQVLWKGNGWGPIAIDLLIKRNGN